nr:ORF6N domain-containing protein [uncultured Desulfovibrio sp.]
MSQATLLPSSPAVPSFPPLAYKGIPVLTTEMLAQAYEVQAKQIRQNFANNRERFVEGKHFFQLSGHDLKDFKNCVENFDSVKLGRRTPSLTLWTERGAARNAKMLNSDRAWDVFELLEETFFRVVRKEPESRPLADDMVLPPSEAPISSSDQSILQSIVKAKIASIPEDQRGKGLFPHIWSRFNNHFRLGSYKQLPQCRMTEAVTYLMGLELSAGKREELPPSLPQDLSRDSSPRADALRRVANLRWGMASAIDVLRLFCDPRYHPHQYNRMSQEVAINLYRTAHGSLVAAYNALEAAHRLQHDILPTSERP